MRTDSTRMRTSQEATVARAKQARKRQKKARAFIIYGSNFHMDLVRDIKEPNI